MFTGNDGVKVAIDQAVTIPAANPPQFGVATVTARTIAVGAAGNINALDINTSCCLPSVAVKNTAPFTGGIDARDYQAVAQTDIDSLTSKLKQVLSQQIQRAFTLRPGEALHTTTCILKASSYHQAGEEAKTVIVEVVNNCEAVAYNQTEVTQKATETYITEDNPGMLYRLVGSVQVRVLSVSPFTVGCSGTWAYLLTQGYQRYHATRFAGDTPEQAKRYLLNTGFIGQVMIAQNLPKDADYIRFRVFVGL